MHSSPRTPVPATVGRTRDSGWQVGVRRTLPVAPAEVWDLLTSQPWLQRWSGSAAQELADLEVRSLTVERLVRVRTPESLVQLRLLPAATGTTVAFHEEHLPDAHARSLRKAYWSELLDEVAADLHRT